MPRATDVAWLWLASPVIRGSKGGSKWDGRAYETAFASMTR